MTIWIILLCWGLAALIGWAGAKMNKSLKDDPAQKKYWGIDSSKAEEKPEHHWTEYVTDDNDDDDDPEDQDDDWEWDRVDDLGDSWDQEDGVEDDETEE